MNVDMKKMKMGMKKIILYVKIASQTILIVTKKDIIPFYLQMENVIAANMIYQKNV
jgi:hypothetical protein